jgi:hypothetical protein
MHANEIILNVFENEISTKSNSTVLSDRESDFIFLKVQKKNYTHNRKI